MSTNDRLSRIEQLIGRLSEREEYYEAFLDASPWGILVVDETMHIVYANNAMCRMSGYSFDELDGQHLHMLIPPETREVHSKHEEDYILHPRVRYGDHPFRPYVLRSDGSRKAVEISLAPAEVKGETYFFASVRPRETLEVPDDIQ